MCGPKVSREVIDLSYMIDDEERPEDQVEIERRFEIAPGPAPADETVVDETPAAPIVDQEIEEPVSGIHDYLFVNEAYRNFWICWELNRCVREAHENLNRWLKVAHAKTQLLMPNHDMMMMEEERRMEEANNDLSDFLATLQFDFETNHTDTAPGYTNQFTGSETVEGSTSGIPIW